MRYSSLVKRLSAWLIDMILFIAFSSLFVYLDTVWLHLPGKALLSGLFFLWIIYNVSSQVIAGNTFGQYAMGIKVIDQRTQKKISLHKAMLRQVLLLAVVCLFFIFHFDSDRVSMPYMERKKYALQVAITICFVLDNILCIFKIYGKTIEDTLSGSMSIHSYRNLNH